MPTYLYDCPECGPFERWGSIHVDTSIAICEWCGNETAKCFVPPQLSPRLGDRHLRESQSKPSAAPAGNFNSWEAGIATDDRGAPLWDAAKPGSPIPLKKYAQHRHQYEARRRELANHPDPFGGVAAQSLKEGR